ncbi:unnamed protein product [Peniophora sp. CBMAI 1063]|nr:unnamed protein product [Peniophora sp. CBMAI 1063]
MESTTKADNNTGTSKAKSKPKAKAKAKSKSKAKSGGKVDGRGRPKKVKGRQLVDVQAQVPVYIEQRNNNDIKGISKTFRTVSLGLCNTYGWEDPLKPIAVDDETFTPANEQKEFSENDVSRAMNRDQAVDPDADDATLAMVYKAVKNVFHQEYKKAHAHDVDEDWEEERFDAAEWLKLLAKRPEKKSELPFFFEYMTPEMNAEVDEHMNAANALAKASGGNAGGKGGYKNAVAAKYFKEAPEEIKRKVQAARDAQYDEDMKEWSARVDLKPRSPEEARRWMRDLEPVLKQLAGAVAELTSGMCLWVVTAPNDIIGVEGVVNLPGRAVIPYSKIDSRLVKGLGSGMSNQTTTLNAVKWGTGAGDGHWEAALKDLLVLEDGAKVEDVDVDVDVEGAESDAGEPDLWPNEVRVAPRKPAEGDGAAVRAGSTSTIPASTAQDAKNDGVAIDPELAAASAIRAGRGAYDESASAMSAMSASHASITSNASRGDGSDGQPSPPASAPASPTASPPPQPIALQSFAGSSTLAATAPFPDGQNDPVDAPRDRVVEPDATDDQRGPKVAAIEPGGMGSAAGAAETTKRGVVGGGQETGTGAVPRTAAEPTKAPVKPKPRALPPKQRHASKEVDAASSAPDKGKVVADEIEPLLTKASYQRSKAADSTNQSEVVGGTADTTSNADKRDSATEGGAGEVSSAGATIPLSDSVTFAFAPSRTAPGSIDTKAYEKECREATGVLELRKGKGWYAATGMGLFLKAVPTKFMRQLVPLGCDVARSFWTFEMSNVAPGNLKMEQDDGGETLPAYTVDLLRKCMSGKLTKPMWAKRTLPDEARKSAALDANIDVSFVRQWVLLQPPSRRNGNHGLSRLADEGMEWEGRLPGGVAGVRVLVVTLLCWGANITTMAEAKIWERVALDFIEVLNVLQNLAGAYEESVADSTPDGRPKRESKPTEKIVQTQGKKGQ